MVTIMLLWSISLLPLALGNDDLPQLQVKIIKEGSFNNYVRGHNSAPFDHLPAYSKWTFLVIYPESGPWSRPRNYWTTPEGLCDTAENIAQPGDFLSVHYTGRFDDENGEIFDTSEKRGQLYKFQLGAGRVRKKTFYTYLYLELKKISKGYI